jgi:hypothetical protein
VPGQVDQELLLRIKRVADALLQNVAAMHRLVTEGNGLAMRPGATRKRIEPLGLDVIAEARALHAELRALDVTDRALDEFVRIPVDPAPAAKALLRIYRELSASATTHVRDDDDDQCPLCGGELPIGADVCEDCRDD